MMRELHPLLLISIMVVATAAAFSQNRELQTNDLIGSYTYSGSFSGSTITIEPEGKFHIKSSNCTQEYYEAGTYSFKNGVLSFATTKLTVRSHGQSDDQARDLLNPKVYEEEFQQKPRAEDRRREIVPVAWSDRIYLMEKGSFLEFCNAINLSLEPRKRLGTDWYLGSFYLREGDEKKEVTGRPSLPTDVLAHLLELPVECEIKSLLQEAESHLAIIEKGKESGLKPGMRFVLDDERALEPPDLWSGFVVTSVSDHFAKVRVGALHSVKVGDKISTKFVERRFVE